MVTILPALRQVREDLVRVLSRQHVESLCREVGYRWRDRQLDPWTTVHLLVLQVLHNNTAMVHLTHLAGQPFTASAYCQARKRLPIKLLEKLVDRLSRRLDDVPEIPRWRGHRVLIVDGSGFSMPDTPELQAYFGQPGQQKFGCGFPVAHILCLFDAQQGFLRDVIVSPLRTHDMAHVCELHPRLLPGDVLIGDRGFCSYAHLALVSQAKMHAIFRLHQRQIVSFRPHRPTAREQGKGYPTSRWIKTLGPGDQVVEWAKPDRRPKWMTPEQFEQLPARLMIREIKWHVRERNRRAHQVILVTTLLDPERYPPAEIARLYGQRWQVEVDLRDLKTTLGLDVLKGHSVDTVKKELLAFVIVYNLVRTVMAKAAQRQRVEPNRISFIDALRWLRPAKPATILPALIINPIRGGRQEPRCIKRRMKEYDLMKQPRAELRKRLKKRRDAA